MLSNVFTAGGEAHSGSIGGVIENCTGSLANSYLSPCACINSLLLAPVAHAEPSPFQSLPTLSN
jgi:hypothetical protein